MSIFFFSFLIYGLTIYIRFLCNLQKNEYKDNSLIMVVLLLTFHQKLWILLIHIFLIFLYHSLHLFFSLNDFLLEFYANLFIKNNSYYCSFYNGSSYFESCDFFYSHWFFNYNSPTYWSWFFIVFTCHNSGILTLTICSIIFMLWFFFNFFTFSMIF